jgi:hypothetical protein
MNDRGRMKGFALALVCAVFLALVTVSAGAVEECAPQQKASPTGDEEEIRRVVTDSQFNEMLVIYVNPKTFDQALLAKYWVPENRGGQAVVKVQSSVQRLLDKKWRYANDSANELFEIRDVRIFPPGDMAEVRTRERWYVPMVDEQGRLVQARDSVLEFPVRYRLLKIDGRWLLLTSSAAYRDRD